MWQPFGKLFQIPLVVRAAIIDTFVNTEVFTVFDRLEGMPAVRALEFERGNNLFSAYKGLSADLAHELSAAAGVVVDVLMRSPAERADSILGNCAGLAAARFDWFRSFSITEPVVLVPELPILLDKGFDDGQFVGKEFLVFGAVEFIVRPLLERDISADEKNKPADLAILFLNDVK